MKHWERTDLEDLVHQYKHAKDYEKGDIMKALVQYVLELEHIAYDKGLKKGRYQGKSR